jgi:hypothetical protein
MIIARLWGKRDVSTSAILKMMNKDRLTEIAISAAFEPAGGVDPPYVLPS